jgi:FxLD family lantipeptide
MTQTLIAATPVVDIDLDVQFAAKGPAVGELMNDTSDGCGSTGQSACAGCVTD